MDENNYKKETEWNLLDYIQKYVLKKKCIQFQNSIVPTCNHIELNNILVQWNPKGRKGNNSTTNPQNHRFVYEYYRFLHEMRENLPFV